jgi:hypothetical protein
LLRVTAYPIPDDPILLHDRERSIIKTDTNRIDVLLAFQFLELQAGMRRIALEQPIGSFERSLSGGRFAWVLAKA